MTDCSTHCLLLLLLSDRIRPQHLKKRALLLKLIQCLLYLFILYMPLNINKEDILPHFFSRRPRLYLSKIYPAISKYLKIFTDCGINLTKIESRPSRKKMWEYIFFVDIEGHIEDEKIKKALDELEQQCTFLKVLGSYPVGE